MLRGRAVSSGCPSLKGDRADIKGATRWANGVITSEVSRKLTTGSRFDVQFSDLNATYGFGFAACGNAQVRHAVHYGPLYLRFARQKEGRRRAVARRHASTARCRTAPQKATRKAHAAEVSDSALIGRHDRATAAVSLRAGG